MQHVTLKATTVTTDQELGEFEAIVSAWDADRENDTIDHHAFDGTIQAWQESGKNLPLLFEHSTTVVGSIDPMSMHTTERGLIVYGEVNRETEEGRQVWRSIKANTAGFSIGFAAESRPRKGGGRVLTEIDLLEVSATSTPMHAATRALAWKSATPVVDDLWLPDFPTEAQKAMETKVQDIERWAAEGARRNRPIKTATFEVE